jgi:hypothetical protein
MSQMDILSAAAVEMLTDQKELNSDDWIITDAVTV